MSGWFWGLPSLFKKFPDLGFRPLLGGVDDHNFSCTEEKQHSTGGGCNVKDDNRTDLLHGVDPLLSMKSN